MNNNAEIITSLLRYGVSPDTEDTLSGKPVPILNIAIALGQVQAVKALLAGHANPNITAKSDPTPPVMLAVMEGHLECVEALLAAKADPNYQITKRFELARSPETPFYKNDVETFPDSVVRTASSETALMFTLEKRNYLMARLLLTHGAKVSLTQKSIVDPGAYKHRGVFSCLPPEETATEEDKRMRADLIKALYKETREKCGLIAAAPTHPAKH